MSGYSFKVEHVPGAKNKVADLLSRQKSPSHQAVDIECPSNGQMIKAVRVQHDDDDILGEDPLLTKWKEVVSGDPEYKELLEFRRSGKRVKD